MSLPTTRTSAPQDVGPHCSDAELNDRLDGRLDAAAEMRVAGHCAACAACQARLDALARVAAAARGAPEGIAPPDPDAIYQAVAARIGTGEARTPTAGSTRTPRPAPAAVARPASLPTSPTSLPASRWRPRRRSALLAAAGVVIAVVSSLGTAALLRRPASPPVAARQAPARGATEPTRLVADRAGDRSADRAVAAAVDGEADRTLATLRAAAAAGDQVLAARTLAVLERSLATVDSAIAEADAALGRDPNNAALAALLARTYDQKRALVRRGAFLGSRS